MANLHLEDVIIEPLVSEKGTQLASQKKYCFKVHVEANKPMIIEALEKGFGVKVKDVNILVQKGKKRRTKSKNVVTYSKKWKKAVVGLRSGEFSFFETLK